jgi:hypothetical protein
VLDSFARLGLDNKEDKSFELELYNDINQLVIGYEKSSREFFTEGLDGKITIEEVEVAIKSLKKNKASGIDGIVNEIIIYGGVEFMNYLCILFNNVFESEELPEEWSKGLISPLFKGGPDEGRVDPNKYRGITLLSVVGKTYTAILNNRINDYCERNKILVESSVDFVRLDQLLINFYINRNH